MKTKPDVFEITLGGVGIRFTPSGFHSVDDIDRELSRRLKEIESAGGKLDTCRKLLLLALDLALELGRKPGVSRPRRGEEASVVIAKKTFRVAIDDADPEEIAAAAFVVEQAIEDAHAQRIVDSNKEALFAAVELYESLFQSRQPTIRQLKRACGRSSRVEVRQVRGRLVALSRAGAVISGKIKDETGHELAFSFPDSSDTILQGNLVLDKAATLAGVLRRGKSGSKLLARRLFVYE